jgi:glycosyltransferase involved in cell wall biosynthesis
MRLFSSKIKFLYCPHGWAGAREMEGVLRPTLLRRGEAWLSRWAHCVVNVSQTDFDYARKNNYGGQHVLIENAVVPAQRDVPLAVLKGSDTDIHLLFVGRFDHQKGLDILLKAFTDARRTRADLRLHVIGAPVAGSGGAYNNSMHIEGVDFLGWVGADKIDGYYRAADVVVLPSRWEGLPLVLPEALRNGTPVLVSDRSGLPHLIDEGRSGFSVVLDVASVSNAISALSKDSLIAMRPAAINLFNQRYNASRLCAEICELYFEVADNMNQ